MSNEAKRIRKLLEKYVVSESLDGGVIDPNQDAIVNEWDDTTLENLEFEDYDDVEEFMDFLWGLDEEDFVKVSYLANIGQNDYQYVMAHYNDVLVNGNFLADAARSEMEERFSSLPGYYELTRYIDYDAYANDMLNSGCWYEYEGYIILNADQY
jgi:hypothetical protein